jgi:glycosyltransferase involved in cell wall biosynthesis
LAKVNEGEVCSGFGRTSGILLALIVMAKLSVVIITLNEAHSIEDCLRSVDFADEIIVLDSGSSDGTPEICRRYTPHVFETDWPGFGRQKNRAIDKTTGDWILNLDADERVSPELAAEVKRAIESDKYHGYRIKFLSSFLGKVLNYGDWSRTWNVRLVRRGCGRFSETAVHERLLVEGSVGDLRSVVVHYSMDSLEELLEKINRYSSCGAAEKRKRGQNSSLGKALSHGSWTFFRSYFLRRGFLDGREGFLEAFGSFLGCFFRYAKLMYPDSRGR